MSLDDATAQSSSGALLVLFICNHCPFVIAIMEQLQKVAKDYASRGLSTVAISSNSVQTHPQGTRPLPDGHAPGVHVACQEIT